ncbi:MAG: DUF1848 family protein [Nitrososphaerales archaeon]
MIVSVSRRTDIPAFYAQWFINRVRAGYCVVPNPFCPEKVSVVSLREPDVDCFMFCTRNLLIPLAQMARENGMEIVSCAEETGWEQYGIRPGKCVDDELIAAAYGRETTHAKNPAMRAACGCVVSRDIGMYNTCLHGYAYCYATVSFVRARANHAAHNPNSPSLLGWYDAPAASAGEWAQPGLFVPQSP